jgi:hypothetical protein
MKLEAGWGLRRDTEPVIKEIENIQQIKIVDIFSRNYPHPESRVSYRTGEEVCNSERQFGKPMGQRDAEFILVTQETRKVSGLRGGFASIPKNQIEHREGIDGYFGELLFPGTMWIDGTGVEYFPVLVWSGFEFFMVFVPCELHWSNTPFRIAGLPTLFPK